MKVPFTIDEHAVVQRLRNAEGCAMQVKHRSKTQPVATGGGDEALYAENSPLNPYQG